MEKLFKNALSALLIIALIVPMGCSKSGSNGAQVPLPDISDFTILNATPFTAGAASSTVNIYCTSLGSGTYKVFFDLTGSNTIKSQSATLNMYDSYGSFKTPVLPNPGATFLTINSITNINGGGTAFRSNNKYTLNDSTGLMTAVIGGNSFTATDVLATVTGNKLTIRGMLSSEPNITSITLNIDSFTRSNGTINFSNRIVPEIANALYQLPAGGGNVSANGTITILSVQPTLSGTFSFTSMDSTKITSGSFNTATP